MTLEKQPLGMLYVNMSSEKMKMRRCKGIQPTMQTDMNSERMQSNELKLKGSEGQNCTPL